MASTLPRALQIVRTVVAIPSPLSALATRRLQWECRVLPYIPKPRPHSRHAAGLAIAPRSDSEYNIGRLPAPLPAPPEEARGEGAPIRRSSRAPPRHCHLPPLFLLAASHALCRASILAYSSGLAVLLRDTPRLLCLLAALRHSTEQYFARGFFVENLLPHSLQPTSSTVLIFRSILALHRLQ